MAETIRGWRPPRSYKTISDAQKDTAEAMRRVAEATAIMNKVAETLNMTNPGNGDILYGVAATLAETIEELSQASGEISNAMRGEEIKGFRARKLMQKAVRKAPTAKERKAIRTRQSMNKAT